MADLFHPTRFAGIDWGGEHHQLCVVDHQGLRLTEQRVMTWEG